MQLHPACCVKTIIHHREGYKVVAGVRCKRWDCPSCGPRKRRAVALKAASGKPERFITPTINPAAFGTPDLAARALRRAWTTLMQAIRRKWPGVNHQYFCVFEKTEAGWPHLHVLYRGVYLPQAWLSNKLSKYLESPVVDIRKVGSKNQAVRYVTKYLAKDPARMEACYRHSCSRAWVLEVAPPNPLAWKNFEGWKNFLNGPPSLYLQCYRINGWLIEGTPTYSEVRPPPGRKVLEPIFYER